MKTKSYFLLSILFFIFSSLSSQVAINKDGSSPDPQAMLDIQSSNKGILIPRISIPDLDDEAPLSNPITAGMLVYNTNASTGEGFYFWDDAGWIKMDKSGELSGTASKIIQVEYAGASLVPDGTNNSGFLTSGNTGSSQGFMNYYNWVSSEAVLQDYDVFLRFDIPGNFLSWQSDGIVINYNTDDISSLENSIDIRVYQEGLDEPLASVIDTTSTTWQFITILAASLVDLTAGETALIKITLSSRNGNAARVGDVSLQYDY